MNEVILWGIWYGVFATLPLVMTVLYVENAMARATACRHVSLSREHRKEARHETLEDNTLRSGVMA